MAKLIDLCSKGSSNIAQKDLAGCEGQYPIYGAAGFIKNVDFYHQDKPYIAIVKDGAGVGRVMKLPANSSVIGTMQYIIPNEGVNVSYLAYALEHMNLAKYYLGAAIPHIYFKDYCNEELPAYTTKEQNNIAISLDKVTELIALRKEQLAKLDQLVKSRFIELFESVNYPVCRLGDVCSKITDGTHKTPNYLDAGVTFISAKNIVNGELDFSDVKYISDQEYAEIQKRCQTEMGDILLSKSGSLGAPVIVKTTERIGLFESLAVIKYDRSKLLPAFLCEQLKSDRIQRQFKVGTKGVAIKHLHLGVIADTDIVVPPIEDQNAFAAFVEQTDKSKFVIQRSSGKQILKIIREKILKK